MSRPFEENDLVLNLEDLQAAAEGADWKFRPSASGQAPGGVAS